MQSVLKIFVTGLGVLALSAIQASRAEETNGAALVGKLCGGCHGFDPGALGMQGPTLRHIFGRKAGIARGYVYSDTLHNLSLTWDEATLDAYLADPRQYAPGTKKFTMVKDADVRRRVIAELKATQSAPVKTPEQGGQKK